MNCSQDREPLETTLALIHTRQQTSTKRLGEPGPDAAQIETILGAASAAPDHGRITPWRLVIVPQQRRHLLAEAFAAALLERDSTAAEYQLQEARDKAYRGPLLVMVIARLAPALGKAHPQERIISAGCAIQNMLLTAHAMGFGAGLSSGRALYSQPLRRLFQLSEDEQPLCFVAVGTVTRGKPIDIRPKLADYTSTL